MKAPLFALSLILFFSCKNTETKTETVMTETPQEQSEGMPFYIGTYTNGDSKGIYKAVLNADGSLTEPVLAVESENPSFLAFSKNKDILLAVNENENGSIESFQVEGDQLLGVNQSPTGGAHPCFVAVNGDEYVLVVNYTGGNI
ncbi:MAG: 6-phosphogluconolactonase, partial [Leeuwenhoekiella sp.]